MMETKKYIFAITLLLCSAFTVETYAATLHVLKIINTNHLRSAVTMESISNEVDAEASKISQSLNVKTKFYDVKGANYTSKSLLQTLKTMSIDPLNDIVIVCVVAHGAADTNSQYPIISFGDENKLAYETIMDAILVKQPAYLISLVISCNRFSDTQVTSSYQVQKPSLSRGEFNPSAYQQLFPSRSSPLAVTYLSAQKGSTVKLGTQGGRPFIALINSLRHWSSVENARDNLTWDKILLYAQLITISGNNANDTPSCPYIEIVNVRVKQLQVEKLGEGFNLCTIQK